MDKLFEDKQSMKENRTVSFEAFMKNISGVVSHSPEEISVSLDVSLEYAEILIPAMIIYRGICRGAGGPDYVAARHSAKRRYFLWTMRKSISLLRVNIILKMTLSFLAQKHCQEIYEREKPYQCVLKNALAIFDGMKKIHGMGPRERLLLQIAAILHDCGNFISSSNSSQCAYEIIMSTRDHRSFPRRERIDRKCGEIHQDAF